MTQSGADWQGTFEAEFLRARRVTFEECALAYAGLDLDGLLGEMSFLISPAIRAIPFVSSGRRYYALMDALVRRVGETEGISDAERSRLVNVCIDLVEYARRQTPAENHGDFERALSVTLDSVDLYGRYPQVSQLVADRTRDYTGSFRENEIADYLSAAE